MVSEFTKVLKVIKYYHKSSKFHKLLYRIATNLAPSVDNRRDFDFIGKYLLERVDVRTLLYLFLLTKK